LYGIAMHCQASVRAGGFPFVVVRVPTFVGPEEVASLMPNGPIRKIHDTRYVIKNI
jgi:nucleoside-diphosphate-sugar epimerase